MTDGIGALVAYVKDHKGWQLYHGREVIEIAAGSVPLLPDDVDPQRVYAGWRVGLPNVGQILLSLSHSARREFRGMFNVAFSAGPETAISSGLEACAEWLERWQKSLSIVRAAADAKDIVAAYTLLYEQLSGDHQFQLNWTLGLPRQQDGYLQLLQITDAWNKPMLALRQFADERGWTLSHKGLPYWSARREYVIGSAGFRLLLTPNYDPDDFGSDDGWVLRCEDGGGLLVEHRATRQEVIEDAIEVEDAIRFISDVRACSSREAAASLIAPVRGRKLELLRTLLHIPRGTVQVTKTRIVNATCGARLDYAALREW